MFEPTSHETVQLTKASVDQCVKCTICESQCPVMAVTPLFPGPKYIGPQAERFRLGASVDHSLDYCSSCGTCTVVCPQGVKVSELNGIARAAMKKGHMPWRDQLISRTTLMGVALSPVAPLANAALASKPIRVVAEKVAGIHRDAAMPPIQRHSFQSWWRNHHSAPGAGNRGTVVFFHGCAGNYFEVETSIRAVEVLEHIGYRVLVPKQGCCGMALQSNGLFDTARSWVRQLVADLDQAPRDLPIVSTAGSCQGMLKHEARLILGVDDPELAAVGARTWDICEFLLDLADRGELPLNLRPNPMTVVYHAPCQLKSQGIGHPAVPLLRLIPQLTVVESGATCCGIAGTYGLKREKYPIARAVGQPLFDKIVAVSPKLAVCDTETCRWQLRHHTGAQVEHPIWLLHQAYGLSQPESASQTESSGSARTGH
ncbi:MAG: anaerobic glycerol-3-phosphate dehydrogenase subunit C [Propionibacteriaceae bacterium]|jgi:glycerol-3-phosphate dehydrogenase subunit C|nr:anaerobic glycerol-3-phosphate dehydrogenase subunit C [Propionibacteriaceae bacterium]